MDAAVKGRMADIQSADRAAQRQAFTHLMKATENPVDWTYEAWDDLLKALTHKDNHLRG